MIVEELLVVVSGPKHRPNGEVAPEVWKAAFFAAIKQLSKAKAYPVSGLIEVNTTEMTTATLPPVSASAAYYSFVMSAAKVEGNE